MEQDSNLRNTPSPNPANGSSLITQPPKAISKPNGKRTPSSSRPTKRDFRIWANLRDGDVDETIAKAEHIDLLEVQYAYKRVSSYLRVNSIEVVRAATHSVVLGRLDDADRVIGEMANATQTRYVTESKIVEIDGKMVEKEFRKEVVEPDLNTRGSIIEKIAKLRDMVASKETKTEIQYGDRTNNNLFVGRSMESRLRLKREERGLKNDEDSEVEQIQDAEFEEDDDLAEDDEESAEEGVSEDESSSA